MKLQIKRIRRESSFLDQVKKLGKQNAGWLGFFPEGAFDGYAEKGQILGAQAGRRLTGYALYRVAVRARKAILVHLCVDEEYRNQGIAQRLIEQLKHETSHLRGIGLHCRRDYPAHDIWPRLGFTALGEKEGRGKDRARLTYWWLDHGHKTLFSEAEEHEARDRLKAVIDANVFFDLEDSSEEATASRALLADWLCEEIYLMVTGELFNEIARCEDDAQRSRNRKGAKGWPLLSTAGTSQQRIYRQLEDILRTSPSQQDRSDLRHLTIAIAGQADFFLTKDRQLLNAADQIGEHFDIQVLRPRELIVSMDERLNGATYQPRGLVGSKFSIRKIGANELKWFRQQFQRHDLGEKKSEFLAQLETLISDPEAAVRIIEEGSREIGSNPIVRCGLGERLKDPLILDIPLLRIRNRDRMSLTLFRHLLQRAILTAVTGDRLFVRVRERHLSDEQIQVLREMRFNNEDGQWIRFSPDLVTTRNRLADEIKAIQQSNPELERGCADLLRRTATQARHLKPEAVFEWEGDLWPSKIQDSPTKNFLVPIRPNWAKELFDKELAQQNLYASKAGLVLNYENVYYRASRPAILEAPGRVLWYVSGQQHVPGTRMIRACSRLLQVEIGSAKEIYSRFKRLGIYQWKDIEHWHQEKAKVMAFRFEGTELFDRPIALDKARAVVREEENRSLFLQSPSRIRETAFFRLYRHGKG